MKRREHILVVSLALFNSEGEANLSAVDIANELDISPGNLYYHFKGKEEIVSELYEKFEAGFELLLQDGMETGAGLEEYWLYLYVTLEHIHNFRFFFRNITDLLQKYQSIEPRFRRLMEKQSRWVRQLLTGLLEEGVIVHPHLAAERVERLTDSIMLLFTYWYQFQNLRNRKLDQHDFIQSAILQIMTLLAPYMGDQQLQFMEACLNLYQREKQG
ncbi:TetR/AcrR family transcriptional regulator [Porticoccus sp.]